MFNQLAKLTDEDLVSHYKKTKNTKAVGELFKRHALMCFAVCNKYLRDQQAAEDAAMSVFEKLFHDLLHHEISHVKSWLHSVCRNHCLMHLRKAHPTVRIHQDDKENENNFVNLDRFVHQEDNVELKEQHLVALESAIEGLKEKQKECIALFYLKQKSYEEIVNITGYSNNEVKSYIQNGKRNLKLALEAKGLALWVLFILWI